MIIELKIVLASGRHFDGEWEANIQLDESATLEDLHCVIQRAVRFDNDHSYSFLHISRLQSFFFYYYLFELIFCIKICLGIFHFVVKYILSNCMYFVYEFETVI